MLSLPARAALEQGASDKGRGEWGHSLCDNVNAPGGSCCPLQGSICHTDPFNLVQRSILSCVRSAPSPLLLCLDQRHGFPSKHRGKRGSARSKRGGSKPKHLAGKAVVESPAVQKRSCRGTKPCPCTQHSQVTGTEPALVVVGDPVGATHRAQVFGAEQRHFALLAGCVGVPAAVHLARDQTQHC